MFDRESPRQRRELSFKADRGRSYVGIERAMQSARQMLGVGSLERLPGVKLFEKLHYLRMPFRGRAIPVVPDCQEIPSEALTIYDPGEDQLVLALSTETYDHLEEDGLRARFTLAHEVGHLFLHIAVLVRMGKISHREMAALHRETVPQHQIYEDCEWQADAAAGALLMPSRRVLDLIDNAQVEGVLQKEFGVSRDAAACRVSAIRRKRAEFQGFT